MDKKFCLFLLLAFLFAGSAAASIKVTKIEAMRDRGFDYLDIYTTDYVKAQGLLLEDKLVIDFPGAKVAKNLKIFKKKSKRIKRIVAKQAKGNARIVIYLKKNIDYEIVNVFGRNKSVVEISDRLDYADRLMAAWEEANLKKKAPKLKPHKYKALSAKKKLPLSGRVVVIDPGHGGVDPGAAAFRKSISPFKPPKSWRAS
jgi:N-acetylmuramoyl-L-alanine amidase